MKDLSHNDKGSLRAVHFATTDYGGAYRAAERISACMKNAGIDSRLFVRTKTRPDTDCTYYFNGRMGRFISKVKNVCNLVFSSGNLVSDLFGTDISVSSSVREADVIFLHWVNSFVSYRSVRRLADTGKKIIWVMHDEWIYTEGYHYTCERVEDPGLYVRLLSRMNMRLKRSSFAERNITFVAVSNWIRDRAIESDILLGERILTIHNPLDTDLFKPLEVRENPYDTGNRKVILFGADKATSNKTKGFSYLIEALKYLDGTEYCAICFGNAPMESRVTLDNMEIIYTGSITDDHELIKLYNLADVMVTPSIQEAFGYTCLEALACGTPVAAFDTSGLRDQIIHRMNGYLAAVGDPHDLARGIKYCVSNRERLSLKARERAVKLCGYPVVGAKYAALLDEVLE